MLWHSGKRLTFQRTKHEPDVSVWLDFEYGVIGDSEHEDLSAPEEGPDDAAAKLMEHALDVADVDRCPAARHYHKSHCGLGS